MRAAALFAALLLATSPLAAQEGPHLPPGPWQGTYQLDRIDPRIRTRGGADLIRMQVIHSKGEATVTVSWTAGRAICEDPLAEPCEWIGANGTTQGRIVGDQLAIALPVSADEGDPFILLMPWSAKGPMTGHLFNAKADFAWRFYARKIDERIGQ
jgi:hypothetical protein